MMKSSLRLLVTICSTFNLVSTPVFANNTKDMYYAQMNLPSQQSNIGMSYWIELRRGKTTLKVDSRFTFKNGDRIKFHITPNVDGHAHVVLLRGTSGKQAVLFPLQSKDASNYVRRGKEYIIPSSSYLVFDSQQGRELVRVALSRKNVNTALFLRPKADIELAMATISANPVIDPTAGKNQLLVAFPEDQKEPEISETSGELGNEDVIPNEASDSKFDKDLFREDLQPKPQAATVAHLSQAQSHHSSSHVRPHHAAPHALRPPLTTHVTHQTVNTATPTPTTIVVNTNGNEDLYAEISLEHK